MSVAQSQKETAPVEVESVKSPKRAPKSAAKEKKVSSSSSSSFPLGTIPRTSRDVLKRVSLDEGAEAEAKAYARALNTVLAILLSVPLDILLVKGGIIAYGAEELVFGAIPWWSPLAWGLLAFFGTWVLQMLDDSDPEEKAAHSAFLDILAGMTLVIFLAYALPWDLTPRNTALVLLLPTLAYWFLHDGTAATLLGASILALWSGLVDYWAVQQGYLTFASTTASLYYGVDTRSLFFNAALYTLLAASARYFEAQHYSRFRS